MYQPTDKRGIAADSKPYSDLSARAKDTIQDNLGILMVASCAAAAGGIYYALRSKRSREGHDDAPGRTARKNFGKYAVTGKVVTINRPREELYAFWRDFQNLPTFMDNIQNVQPTGANDSAVWTISAPAGTTVEVETEVVQDRPDELIAWRSVKGSDIDTEGRVTFRDAPNGAGTWVEAIIAYRPPGGKLGRLIAKALRKDPGIEARHDLKRLKMLMETGELATAQRYIEKD